MAALVVCVVSHLPDMDYMDSIKLFHVIHLITMQQEELSA